MSNYVDGCKYKLFLTMDLEIKEKTLVKRVRMNVSTTCDMQKEYEQFQEMLNSGIEEKELTLLISGKESGKQKHTRERHFII